MDRIRLELNYLDLERNKKRWSLYIVLATDNPEKPGEVVITTLPSGFIKVRKPAENLVQFEPEGEGTEGLFVLERDMPSDFSVRARLWLMHSRKGQRDFGEKLSEIGSFLGNSDGSQLIAALGASNPWVSVGIQGIGAVGTALSKIKDRQLGFLNLDEHFNANGEEDMELERKNRLSTGFGEVGWSWVVDND
ncbi:hypothetical protein FNH22_07770 [Fulvivirga sp. M361]|uniref:hypothetical protein n=1 Tax=Fulvivirga sp. M361 TaxID=2594266 RepID=UPI00117B2D5E|nr:hypothetical protein [Fulvivirga sp. M361]TRX59943.1 hypothetical protein FNH22_07770 [Fulvivirga sp. M361]